MSEFSKRLFQERPHLPYILPIVIFGAFLAAEGRWPEAKWILYPLKTVATGACLWWVLAEFKNLSWRWSWLGVVIGLVVVVQWVGMEELFKTHWRYPALPMVGADIPWEMNSAEEYFKGGNFLFNVVLRMLGAVVVVPIMEELFWRGFLLRLFVGRYFERVELGEFSWFSCVAVAAAFALMHPWYISAFVCCLLYNLLMYRTKSLLACVVAHALTNLLLWVYILSSGAWWLA